MIFYHKTLYSCQECHVCICWNEEEVIISAYKYGEEITLDPLEVSIK